MLESIKLNNRLVKQEYGMTDEELKLFIQFIKVNNSYVNTVVKQMIENLYDSYTNKAKVTLQ